jgi:pectate lyase
MKSQVSFPRAAHGCWFGLALLVACSGNKSTTNGLLGDEVAGTGALPTLGTGGSAGSTSTVGTGGNSNVAGRTATGASGVSAVGGTGGAKANAGSGAGGSAGANSSSGGAAGATGVSGTGSGGSGGTGSGGNSGSAGRGADGCAPAPSAEIGWAFDSSGGPKTTGGEGGPTVSVSSLSDLTNAVKGTNAQIIEIKGSISGTISIGSNKTLIGCAGAQFKGHIAMNGSANVIVRNLKIVGNNCTDNPSDCSGGEDAITVQTSANHLWFDHDDISDGSDGNLDLTHASDYITISWTKFHYSGRRTDPAGAAGGHQFSNLIGHSDSNSSEDTGHLRITFHHDWWADNVVERMPRVRFGKVHLFNNLYTASGNDYCIGVGVGANIRTENNVFIGVATPINTTSYSDSTSAIASTGNVYMGTSGTAPADLKASSVFTPSYSYTPDATSGLEAAIRAGAGVH